MMHMKKLSIMFSVVVVAGMALAWDMGPVVTYWSGPGMNGRLTDANVAALKEEGFNTVWATSPADMPVAERNGMRVIYWDPKAFSLDAIDKPEVSMKLRNAVNAVKNSPALLMYFIFDEPPAPHFEKWARVKRMIEECDPAHPGILNLLPMDCRSLSYYGVGAVGPQAYCNYLRQYAETFQPECYMYDHYQLKQKGDLADYFMNLNLVRGTAMAAGKPFINIVQSCAYKQDPLPRVPTPGELRYLVFTTAAYGARGICYFTYQGCEKPLRTKDGRSDNLKMLMTANREFTAIVKELSGLRYIGAFHAGMLSDGATPFTETAARLKLSPMPPAGKPKAMGSTATDSLTQFTERLTNTVLVSRFDAPGNKAPHGTRWMVVNLDYVSPAEISVKAELPLSAFDVKRGWSRSTDKPIRLALPPGGGMLIKATP